MNHLIHLTRTSPKVYRIIEYCSLLSINKKSNLFQFLKLKKCFQLDFWMKKNQGLFLGVSIVDFV